jgi:hypothetical protein
LDNSIEIVVNYCLGRSLWMILDRSVADNLSVSSIHHLKIVLYEGKEGYVGCKLLKRRVTTFGIVNWQVYETTWPICLIAKAARKCHFLSSYSRLNYFSNNFKINQGLSKIDQFYLVLLILTKILSHFVTTLGKFPAIKLKFIAANLPILQL